MKNKNKTFWFTNKAFTLIEMMIVIFIISLLIIGGLIKRKETLQRKNAETEAQKIKQAIELTRDYALTGETIENANPGADEPEIIVPEEFIFRLYTEGNYEISSNPEGADDPIKEGSVDEDSEATILESAEIYYQVPHGEMSGTNSISICGGGDCTNESMVYVIEISDNAIEIN